ncbi:MAG TPA: ATP-binding protein [Vicinamibacterales bacterium]|nr:ATP-binding protein [Vicinamibacterales bacterium]
MTPAGQAFLGLTAIVTVLVAVLTFAVLRFIAASRQARGRARESGMETAFLSAALQEAVTKLKAQERAMALRAETSERIAEEIIANLTAGLLTVNAAGLVQIVNPVGRRLLRLDDAPQDGRPYRDVLAHAAPVAAIIEECLRTGRPIIRRAVELPGGRASATHLGLTASPLRSDGPAPHGVICLFTDLSSVVALEEQVRLKDSLARVGELTAGIAHEFRNGLATIHGYSRLLDLDALPPAFRPYVEGIRAETEAMREVVTNFLNFARPTQLTLSPVDLRAVAERAADDLRADARALGGDIAVTGEFATIEGDDVLLRQALSNLLRNAIEACAAASVVPEVAITARTSSTPPVCTLVVSDNGPGFPDGVRDRVFHPFFTTKPQGTGLGLALVQKIVVTHNGRVGLGSGPGGRVTLTFSAAGEGVTERNVS